MSSAKSHIEIRVSCNKLKNKDTTSKSDPCCAMYLKEGDKWTQVGKTETIQNNLNPIFERPLNAEYIFEGSQEVRFELYDIDNEKTESFDDDDFLGLFETTLSKVVSESPLTAPLVDKKGKGNCGTITLRTSEAKASGSHSQLELQMTFKATKLDNKDTFGKSDPFLEFFRQTLDHHWEVTFRTEVIKDNLNPTWKPFKVSAHVLSGGDLDNPIRIDCRDWDSDGKHELIGSFITSVAELMKHPSGREWPCINESKVGKKKYVNSGVVSLVSCEDCYWNSLPCHVVDVKSPNSFKNKIDNYWMTMRWEDIKDIEGLKSSLQQSVSGCELL